MLENNCQCELCRSVWGDGGSMKNVELCTDDGEWVDEAYPSAYVELTILNSLEALYENN